MPAAPQVSGRDSVVGAMDHLAGKYLTFRLAREEYAIPILTVVEINKMMEVTFVPRTPSFVRGVINLRGKVIPIVDLREKFGMSHAEDTDETCIIVVKFGGEAHALQMGIVIDTVLEVLDISSDQIEPPPEFGVHCATDFILGMAKTRGAVKILVDIDKVLASDEIAQLQQTI